VLADADPLHEGDQQARPVNGGADAWLHGAWEITEKAPPRERGSSGVHRFSPSSKGSSPGGAQRHRQMTQALALGGATDETPSRAVGFCVGRPAPLGWSFFLREAGGLGSDSSSLAAASK
jgi:hypothetical protein